jgi:hypothetical protein
MGDLAATFTEQRTCETHEPELVPLDLNRFVPETRQQDPICINLHRISPSSR